MRVDAAAQPAILAGAFLLGLAGLGAAAAVRAQTEDGAQGTERAAQTEDGAQRNAGSARPLSFGALRQTAYLKASNTGFADEFGSGGTLLGNGVALSGDGDTLAVGAPYESSGSGGIDGDQDDESVYGAGAVYVFTDVAGRWRQQAYLKAANPGLADNFGYMVALSRDGDTLAVAAPYEAGAATGIDGDPHDDSIPQAGAVYMFTRSGGVWSQQAYIKASNTGEAGRGNELGDGDQFGFALALDAAGDTLAVGAIAEDSGAAGVGADQTDNSAMSAGAVYLYSRSGDAWSQQAYIKPSNAGTGDLFGYSVSLSADGNLLAASAYDEDGSRAGTNEVQNDEVFGTGAVYIFSRADGAWSQRAYLKPSNSERNDSFGVAVALSAAGDTLAAAALDEDGMTTGVDSTPVADMETDLSTGAVYLFGRDGERWSEQAYIKASNTGPHDTFGARLALSRDGGTLAVAAQLEDSAGQGVNAVQNDDSAQEAGAVYVFARDGASWIQTEYIKGSNTEAFDEFGSAVALNDAGTRLAVGARGEDGGGAGPNAGQDDDSALDSGAVYVFDRRPVSR